MNDIQFRIWALQQDNLRRSENIDRIIDDNYRALLIAKYENTEREIETLKNRL